MVNIRPILSTGEIYHIYNRSVAKQAIFKNQDQLRKINNLIYFYKYPQLIRYSKFLMLDPLQQGEQRNRTNPYVSIYAYSYMPNHYHLILKQEATNGVSTFMSHLQNSYAKWFNTKYHRFGSLFQNNFKAVRVTTEEQFIHLSRYTHLNHSTSLLMNFEQLRITPYCSLATYLGLRKNLFLDLKPILSHFKTPAKYEAFVRNGVEYQQTLKIIKDQLLEPF